MHKTKWQLQEAKSRLSELVQNAVNTGPQIITKRGVETAVVISAADYQKLRQPQKHLADVFLESPLRSIHLNLNRDQDPGRDVTL